MLRLLTLSRGPVAAALAVLAGCAKSSRAPAVGLPPLEPISALTGRPPASEQVHVPTSQFATEVTLSCGDTPVPSDVRDSLLAEIGAARVRWTRTRPARLSYEVQIVNGHIALPQHLVTVVDDSVVTPAADPRDKSSTLGPTWLFARAERATQQRVGRIEIALDRRTGLPTLIYTNPMPCVSGSGDEITVTILRGRKRSRPSRPAA